MAEDNGHRLFIELRGGTALLDEALEHLSSYKDTGKRLQELFRCFVTVGCVIDDFSALRGEQIDDVDKALAVINDYESDDNQQYRFRIHNDDGDNVLPGFTRRYNGLAKPEKRVFVTKMYLLGFWFFTRFNSQFERLARASSLAGINVDQMTEERASEGGRPTVVQYNEDAADMLGGLDICV